MTAPVQPTPDAVARPDASARGTVPGPDQLAFLDSRHKIHQSHDAAWAREERRWEGDDGVLEELVQFDGEATESLEDRKKTATYKNFARAYTSSTTGAVSPHRPTPGKGLSYGTLGDVRSRDQIDTPTLAELLEYNVSGIGADGQERAAFFDAVDERAQATGHRWLLEEMPSLAEVRAMMRASGVPTPADRVSPTLLDVLNGFRSYVVEFSPRDVWNWLIRNGVAQFFIVRTAVTEPTFDASGVVVDAPGYYLLVRAGYEGFGPAFAGGGWWKFDSEKKYLESGTWTRTLGQIPMWAHFGRPSQGTKDRPAFSASATMMLGQIGVGLMNVVSARDYDYLDACASRLFFLNADGALMVKVADQRKNVWVGVPSMTVADGDGGTKELPVTVYDGSVGVVSAQASESVVNAKFAEARDEMLAQASTPDSSGESKRAGFQEAKAPALGQRARLLQASEQTHLYFAELRNGTVPAGGQPTGYAIYPTDFDLAPLVEKIDANLDRMKRAGLRSPTLEVGLVKTGLMEDGLWPEEPAEQDAAERELEASAAQASASAIAGRDQAAQDEALLNGDDLSGGDAPPPAPEPPAPRRRRLTMRDPEGNLRQTIDEEIT